MWKSTSGKGVKTDDLSDYQLWQNFKKGDQDALSCIYHSYYDSLYYYGLKICGDENLVTETAQELFVEIWNRRERLGDVNNIKSYLIQSYRNQLFRNIKKNNKTRTISIGDAEHEIEFLSDDFETDNRNKEQVADKLAIILNKLPKRRKEAVYLKYYSNLNYSEIADVMGLTERAVINHIYKAMKSIRNDEEAMRILKMLLFGLAAWLVQFFF